MTDIPDKVMDAPKRIWACPDSKDGWRWPYASLHPVQHRNAHEGRMFVDASEHNRRVIELLDRIGTLEAKIAGLLVELYKQGARNEDKSYQALEAPDE